MIYLIDDKKSRQCDYGWDENRFQANSHYIMPIRNLNELLDEISDIFQSKDNIILFHESFPLMNDKENYKKRIHILLEEKKLPTAYFSGSKNARFVENDSCSLPPDVLYENLSIFIDENKDGFQSFNTLAFGANYNVERDVRNRVEVCRLNNTENNTEYERIPNKKIFFAISQDNIDEVPFLEDSQLTKNWDFFSEEKLQKQISDIELDSFVRHFLSNVFYDVIYIPLYFGNVWSDYLGLRLALHIRLTKTINQRTPIFIYGVSSIDELINNECFDVLKLSGVRLIQSDNKSLSDSLLESVTQSPIKEEMKKIHIPIPTNIGDNHSVANMWAIYRWSKALGDNDSRIVKNNEQINSTLYFKFLDNLYPFQEAIYDETELKVDFNRLTKEEESISVLYIDDEADNWYEHLCCVLNENNLLFEYIGEELKTMKEDDIVNFAMRKIQKFNPHIVILDLRLHPNDYNNEIKEMTGYRILSKIKKENNSIYKGTQVLMFTATNKAWNMKHLIDCGADGFYIKESPEYPNNTLASLSGVGQFMNELTHCLNRSFLKELYQDIVETKNILKKSDVSETLIDLVSNQFDITFALINNAKSKHEYAYAYVSLERIFEFLSNDQIDERNDILYIKKGEECYDWEINKKQRVCQEKNSPLKNNCGQWKKISSIYYQLLGGEDKRFGYEVEELIDKRNAFIHNDRKKLKSIHKDIYEPVAFLKLFDTIIEFIKLFSCL